MFEESNLVSYGPLHILVLALTVIFSFLLVFIFGKKKNPKTDDRVILIISIILILMDIYKQIYFAVVRGYYEWSYFPFQFCSVPAYMGVFAALVKSEKLKKAAYYYLGYFGLIGGTIFSVIPSCFEEYKGHLTIILHSLTWHALIFIMAIYAICARCMGSKFKEEISGSTIYLAICFGIATAMNYIAYPIYFYDSEKCHGSWFNMFYMSPYYNNSMPILHDIQKTMRELPIGMHLGNAIYIVIYFAGMVVIAVILHFLFRLIRMVFRRKNA